MNATFFGDTVKKFSFVLMLLGTLLYVTATVDLADARRLGGGKSFGSRPSYSQKYQSPSSQPGSTSKPAAAPNASPLGGRGGMFGGLLGGMLMGGLLGSLFFGGPFSGPSLIDLLLIGGGLFLLFRFLRSRQPAAATSGQHRENPGTGAWEHMRGNGPSTLTPPPGPQIPPGFDVDDFLKGAKAAYTRMQASWDTRDIEDLRQFTSEDVLREITTQVAADPAPGKTEILLLEAKLLEVRTVGNQTIATVLFDAMLRENTADNAEQVREAWHFSRFESGGQSHWVVEGIQQLEK